MPENLGQTDRSGKDSHRAPTREHGMSPDMFGQMMLHAVRYALGRMTTAPADTHSAVVCAWTAIPPYWRALIDRDVREAVEGAERLGKTVGHDCDHRTWKDLLVWIEEINS